MIEYINISGDEFIKLSYEESKKPYCIKYYNGDIEWRVNGLYHRKDGPAIIWYDRSEYWYINGKRHRENGPAIYKDDDEPKCWYWYLNNIDYSFEKWCEILNKSDEEVIFLKLKYT